MAASISEAALEGGGDECLVCLEAVAKDASIWQCDFCFTVLHLSCTQAFVTATLAPAHKLLASIVNVSLFWACPHCRKQFVEREYPEEYRCFCRKEVNPTPDPFLPSHSCGETCGRPLGCGHSCTLRCHPGRCQKCTQTLDAPCFCTQSVTRARCGAEQLSCGGRCGRTGAERAPAPAPPCPHPCPALCHVGACAPCLLPIPAPCACGRSTKTLPCVKSSWQCGSVCGAALGCGNHTCVLVCHSGPCPPCPASGSGARTCPCGKVPHPELTCVDAAPRCGDTCEKRMACGLHACTRQCHEGGCGPCTVPVEGPCRCGKSKARSKCGDGVQLCAHKCTRVRDCGRHPCKRRCCAGPGEEGEGGSGGGEEGGAHCPPCRMTCARGLLCGNHTCEGFCHTGPCLPCPRTVTLACGCGGTRVTVPCGMEGRVGTPACTLRCRKESDCGHKRRSHPCHTGMCPPCTFPCSRPQGRCGHPCPHPCHTGGGASSPRPCPPCAVTVQRQCVGRHETRTLPCTSPALFRCDKACGSPLACGKHTCGGTCHGVPPGGCGACTVAVCGEVRPPGCPHPCPGPGVEAALASTGGEGRGQGSGGSSARGSWGGGCHPGPCAPCVRVQTESCHCLASRMSTTCVEVTGGTVGDWRSCGKRCRRTLRCGHACPLSCHAGTCSDVAACAKRPVLRCACGAQRQEVSCADAVSRRRGAGVQPDDTTTVLLSCDAAVCVTTEAGGTALPAAPPLTPEEVAARAADAARAALEEAARAREEGVRRRREKERAGRDAAQAQAALEEEAVAEASRKAREEAREAESAFQRTITIVIALLVAIAAGAAALVLSYT